MKVKIEDYERSAELLPKGIGRITFNLTSWGCPVIVDIPDVIHSEVIHPAGFARIFYSKGKQHIAIYQAIAPIAGITDMGVVVAADEKGKVVYQETGRGIDYNFETHHFPGMIFFLSDPGTQVKAGNVTVYQDNGNDYSIDAYCHKVWKISRYCRFGKVEGVMWACEDGSYLVQDYSNGRVIQSVRFASIADGLYHLRHNEAPDPGRIPDAPYEMRNIQAKYNQTWMRHHYRRMQEKGLYPIIQLEGPKNVFSYSDGTRIYDNLVLHPDGSVERPEALFIFDAGLREWVDSPLRKAAIARKIAQYSNVDQEQVTT